MKKMSLVSFIVIIGYTAHAQTNTFPTTGNAGIGTTSPSTTLDIETNTNTTSTILFNNSNTGTSANTKLNLFNGNLYGGLNLKGPGYATDPNTLNVFSPSDLLFSSSATERMRLSGTSGYLGINTTTPGYSLDVNGTGRFTGNNANATSGKGMELFFISSLGAYMQAYDRTANTFDPINIQGSYINFSNTGVANTSPCLSMKGNNVGIGTIDNTSWQLATSAYKLAVNGKVVATSMTVKLTANWPDYVFRSAYQLPSLNSLRTYIDQYHHLPEMPTDEQVAKDGLDLGEMNKLLVKKVEELTLYLIDNDKTQQEEKKTNQQLSEQLKTQQEQIDQLKKELESLVHKNN